MGYADYSIPRHNGNNQKKPGKPEIIKRRIMRMSNTRQEEVLKHNSDVLDMHLSNDQQKISAHNRELMERYFGTPEQVSQGDAVMPEDGRGTE